MKLQDFDDALDRRIGHRRILHLALHEPIPGGASFAYVFGSAALILFLVQLGTGAILATVYSPSATDAWASVDYLERAVPFGRFVRGMHHHASGAMVVVVGLHLLQTALYGAYKAPREVNWLSGLALLGLVLAFALTGYLLPWDQTGYWATKVATSIAGTVPVVGEFLQRVAQGGNDYGNLTLTRFYALHAIVLPLISLGLMGVHVLLFRRHGVTPHPRTEAETDRPTQRPGDEIGPKPTHKPTESFWPRQVFFDAVFACLVLAVVAGLAWRLGAPLMAPADPASTFLARPEWYFLFLFQLLKFFEGPAEIVGTVVIPGLVTTWLVALPFLDRRPTRRFGPRAPFLLSLAIGTAAMGGLTAMAIISDARDPGRIEDRRVAERESHRARALAAEGVPVGGATRMAAMDPLIRGERLFRAECLACHPYSGGAPKKPKGPDLTAYLSRGWVRQVLRDPDGPRLFGLTKVCGMKSLAGLPPADLEKLVDFVYSLRLPGAPKVETSTAASLIEEHECEDCHDFEGDSGLDGPALFGYGSKGWIRSVVEDGSKEHLYGEKHKMPKFERRLSAADLEAVVTFVSSLEGLESAADQWPFVDGAVAPPRCEE
ncbi:MAG: cytochrome b N-terminal domain-containing protein [Deltaproteobacteria bacterium]|nr:cytochrome b N-terminal domain-containing protein [Deltaproteobacteria bacterium]